MKLKQYLTEDKSVSFQEGLQMVYDNCMPYIKDLVKGGFSFFGRADDLMYSGRRDDDYIIKKFVRKDRKPKDMNKDVHDSLNKEFKKKFGYNARGESLFCTGSRSTAMGYGNHVYSIFPIGKYQVIWSPKHRDLFNDIMDSVDSFENIWKRKQVKLSKRFPSETMAGNTSYPEYKKAEDDYLNAIDLISKDVISTYQKGDVLKALKSHKEIMLQTTQWIGFKGFDWDFIFKSYIDKYGTKYPTTKNVIQWYNYYYNNELLNWEKVVLK